jgi:glycosyltransferase involved in cell wall biosynthesis
LSPLVVIPAYQAQGRVGKVVSELLDAARAAGVMLKVLVVDDGSTDDSAAEAAASGAVVLRHPSNQGKGAALQTGMQWAKDQGYVQIVSADADGQHPTAEILRLCRLNVPPSTLVLGVRNLARDGAPSANQCSNAISNTFLSWFTGLHLRDTQCGLRLYPVGETLALECTDRGYAFEAEVLIRASRAGLTIEQVPISVFYPPETERLSHFHVVRDPYRIIRRVLSTLLDGL